MVMKTLDKNAQWEIYQNIQIARENSSIAWGVSKYAYTLVASTT